MYRVKAYKNQDGVTLHLLGKDGQWEADKLTMLSDLIRRYNIPFVHIPMGKTLFEIKIISSDDIHSILFELERNGFILSSESLQYIGK
ncbi:MAG: hypothetical protein OIN86_06010 [Candidatus Methanoperedens sp.]|nr:hypothetical protein [Candidatus Methanoperedens sp.]CAG0966884.1 hypothetical protein METP1_01021 [Methanosarcinales archaeon]